MDLVGDVGEISVSVILIKRERFWRQTARAAHDRLSFPLALAGLARVRRVCEVEVHIVHDDEIQKSITVEIDERATCTPARLWRKQPTFLSFVSKLAIAEVAIENVLSPLRNEQVGIAMIVDISDADSLSPSSGCDSRLVSDVFEFQPAEVVIKEVLRLSSVFIESP